MPSHGFSEVPVDPARSLEELISSVLSLGVHGILGVLLGILAARAMRAANLHWSWAAGSLAVCLLARPLHGPWMLTLATAGLLATTRGRRWHRADLEMGADLAELAARRTRPLDLARSLTGALAERARVQELTGALRRPHGAQLLVGRDEAHRGVSIPFGGAAGGTHTLVVGATGSGKTVTQTWIAARAIERGMGAVVVDPKGDGGMREQLRARRAGCGPLVPRVDAGGRARCTTRTRAAARPRSPTRCWPASASPSRTTCARHSAISATSCARCARRARR